MGDDLIAATTIACLSLAGAKIRKIQVHHNVAETKYRPNLLG